MKKHYLLFIFVGLLSAGFSQQYTSIHQEQQIHYNAQNKSAQWYEDNINTEQHYFAEERTTCNLNKIVYGWHPYWVGSAANNYDWDLLSHLSYFSYEVDAATGDPLTTHGWSTVDAVDSALANGVKVTLCVTLFGSSGLTTFLSNTTSKQTLIDNLINLVQSRGAHGVNIDFEGLPSSQSTNFANFMVDLSNQMHTAIPGSEVSTVLYAVDWNNVFDFAVMDPIVDHFIIMGYAYYYQGSSSTGPCDPLYHFGSTYNYTLSKTITNYLEDGCSKNKLVLGLPYYGYEWATTDLTIPSTTTANGSAKTFANMKNNSLGYYIPANYSWDAASFTDIYTFNNGTTDKQCFVTLENGFRKRLEHVNNSGIAGIGIWALGYDNGYSELWNGINDYLTDCQEDPCSGTLHDFGGPTKNYYNNEDYTWTIAPPGATSLDVNFTMFDVELDFDTLFIYDGLTTAATLIGSYSGTNSPGSFSTSTGALTFYFKSDGATVAAGWLGDYICTPFTGNPQADFSMPSNPTICGGETVQFINSSTNATSYYWEFDNGTPATSPDTNPIVSYAASSTYDVTLNAIDGGDTNTSVQSISVVVASTPTAVFTSNSPIYLPNTAIFFSNASQNASNYYWDFGNGNISSDSNPWHDYALTGTYTVMLVSSNYICPNDTTYQTVEVIDNVGLSQQELSEIHVYPNPFSDYIRLSGVKTEKDFSITLMDISGKIVLTKIDFDYTKMQFSQIDFLAKGTYILEINQDDKSERIVLIKE